MPNPRQPIDKNNENISSGRLDDSLREASPLDLEDDEVSSEFEEEDDMDY